MDEQTAKDEKNLPIWGIIRTDTIKSFRVGMTYAQAKASKDETDAYRAARYPESQFVSETIIKVIEGTPAY